MVEEIIFLYTQISTFSMTHVCSVTHRGNEKKFMQHYSTVHWISNNIEGGEHIKHIS